MLKVVDDAAVDVAADVELLRSSRGCHWSPRAGKVKRKAAMTQAAGGVRNRSVEQ